MSTLSVNAQQKFTNLRKKLDQLGYMQPLSLDSLPLVESLFTDFVWTTESFRKCKSELDKRAEVRERVEDYIEPYKVDNARLLSEYNRAQRRILDNKLQHEESIRDLHAQIRQLEQQKYDLSIFNQQCIDKINRYETEAKQMIQKIMLLQEKNFQAVVHTPEGKRKQIPFRRQRMDIDCFIPRNDHSSRTEDYCCAVSKEQSESYSSDQLDLLDAITSKCKELSHQLSRAEEELELSDRKINGYCDKLKMYEEEICRLTRELSGGRSLEAVSSDGQQRAKDRLADQLNMQIDLLQERNEELEKEILQLNAINISEGKIVNNKKKDNDCMLEIQNGKLRHRIEELVEREKCLLKELHCANVKLRQKKSDCIPVMEEECDKSEGNKEVEHLQRHVISLEEDRNYWRKEAEKRRGVNEDSYDVREELEQCQQEMKDIVCQNNELKQMLNVAERNSSPSLNNKDRSQRNFEVELKKSKAERDALQNLLDKFERQLHDIQGNIRVMSQERDMVTEKYEECQKELHEMRQTLIQSDNPRKDSLAAQSLLRRLELERNDSMTDLHRMTTERDSLRQRLKTVTETALSEKARLCQRLEDCENHKEQLCQEREEMLEKLSILRNKTGELEEHNDQLKRRNDSLSGELDRERSRLQGLAVDVERVEQEVEIKQRRESQLSEELREAEERLVTVQQRSDSQTEELVRMKADCERLKSIVNEVDREKDELQQDLDSQSEQLRDVRGQLHVKEQALEDVRVNMGSLEQQLRRIQEVNNHRDRELRALVVHNEQLENDLRHQVSLDDQLKAENCRIEEDLMSLTRDYHKLEAEFRDGKRCIMELTEEKEQLEQRVVYCQSSESDQQKQNNDLLEQYRELSLDNDKLQLNLQRIENINEELSREVEAREKIVKNMREQLLHAEGEINILQSNIRNLEDQVCNLRQVLGTNNQVTENHSLEKQEILQELAAMRDLCARLENSKENVQRQLSSRLLEQEQLRAENNDLIKDNENLREEIESLQQSLRGLETVMSAGREKEFRNQMDCQQRIAELESENEQLLHLQSKMQQIQRDLAKSCSRNSDLEAECERLRRQLTSERFKLELANQELLRREKASPRTFRDDDCDRPAEGEYYSSEFSFCRDLDNLRSAGFSSDISAGFISESTNCELICNHGCYHSRDCSKNAPEKKNGGRCSHGCRHSQQCLQRKERMKKHNERRMSNPKNHRSEKLLEMLQEGFKVNKNSNNHVAHVESISRHTNPKCPYNTEKKEAKDTQTDIERDARTHHSLQKLPTIVSESLESLESKSRKKKKTTVATSVSDTSSHEENPSQSSDNEKRVVAEKVNLTSHAVEEQPANDIHDLEDKVTIGRNDGIRVHVPKVMVGDQKISLGGKKKPQDTAVSLSSVSKGHRKPNLLQRAPLITNETPMLSQLSRVTMSTANPQASSTLAQVPSLTSGTSVAPSKIKSTKRADIDEENVPVGLVDEDPTDVSQSLTTSFYEGGGVGEGVGSRSTYNSSSGVHTGRSLFENPATSVENKILSESHHSETEIPAEIREKDEDDNSSTL